jgi:hypothetical protein
MRFRLFGHRSSYEYEEMYKPVDVSYLREYAAEKPSLVAEIRERYISVGETVNPIVGVPNAVGVSLFRTRRDNTFRDQYPIKRRHSKRWLEKYYLRLLDNIEWFPHGFDARHWKLVVYLCPESLKALLPRHDVLATLSQYEFIEINIMRFPSVGHGPGALWRFLSMGDDRLDRVLILDIDEPWWHEANTWHRDLGRYDKPYTRAHHMPRDGFWLNPETPWYLDKAGHAVNYATILSSKQLVRPRQLGLSDIGTLISAYVALRMERVESENPRSQLADDEPATPYNRPFKRHKFGWANHWYQYCFDERFLKHVIFPYVVKRGFLCTYCLPQDVTDDLRAYLSQPALKDFLADFRYTQSNSANIIVNNNTLFDERL